MSKRWTKVIGLLILCAAPGVARGAELLCPAGEITLGPGTLRAMRTRAGAGRVRSTRATFVLPTGITIAPESEPLVFALEADRQPIGQIDAAGRRPRLHRRREALRVPQRRLAASRSAAARGGYRLAGEPRRLRPRGARSREPAAVHEADPQDRRRLLLLGARVHRRRRTASCASPERTALLAGRVERVGARAARRARC